MFKNSNTEIQCNESNAMKQYYKKYNMYVRLFIDLI